MKGLAMKGLAMKGLAMTTVTHPFEAPGITLGVDTHKDIHVAAALDPLGRLLETAEFPVSASGYRDLACWGHTFGKVGTVGIEGTGSWGVGLSRHLLNSGLSVVEVNAPNRQDRRRHGKTDTTDAIAAARAVLAGTATGTPRGNKGAVEGLRANRITLRSAIKARTQAMNQLKALVAGAPEPLHDQLSDMNTRVLVETVTAMRPGAGLDVVNTTKAEMRTLGRRIGFLNEEIVESSGRQERLITATAPPELLAEPGVGNAVAADLLIAFGDNPQRIGREGSFASLCGVSPVDCSSGRQQRHRLNRGGDRHANRALWTIVFTRLKHDETTRAYMAKSTARGKTKKETSRSRKRYVARHIWRLLQQHPPTLDK
jgi:transposase